MKDKPREKTPTHRYTYEVSIPANPIPDIMQISVRALNLKHAQAIANDLFKHEKREVNFTLLRIDEI